MSKFVVVFDTPEFKVRKREIHKLIKLLSEELNFKIFSLEITFVDAEEMKNINVEYHGKDYDTDIITLQFSESPEVIDASIYISYPMAIYNAEKYKVSVNNEIIRLIIHGILHLVGYDDTTKSKRSKMKKVENELTEKFSYFELLK